MATRAENRRERERVCSVWRWSPPRRVQLRKLKKQHVAESDVSRCLNAHVSRCGPINNDRAHRLGYADVPRKDCRSKQCWCNWRRDTITMGPVVGEDA